MRHISLAAFLALPIIAALPLHADVIWNESVQGDLSNNRFEPTMLMVAPGSNQFFGLMNAAGPNGEVDRDYFTLTIPEGHQLSSITLDIYFSQDFAAFLGIQPGPVFPNDPDTVQPNDLLGWTLISTMEEGQNVLPIMGSNGTGFTPPLPAGTYSFWAQQTGDRTEYALTFGVEPIPAPGALTLITAGSWLLLRRRRITAN